MGIPTANLEVPADITPPSRGVYAGRAVLEIGRSAAAINIGVAPTFTSADAGATLGIEAFLLDHDGSELPRQAHDADRVPRAPSATSADSSRSRLWWPRSPGTSSGRGRSLPAQRRAPRRKAEPAWAAADCLARRLIESASRAGRPAYRGRASALDTRINWNVLRSRWRPATVAPP